MAGGPPSVAGPLDADEAAGQSRTARPSAKGGRVLQGNMAEQFCRGAENDQGGRCPRILKQVEQGGQDPAGAGRDGASEPRPSGRVPKPRCPGRQCGGSWNMRPSPSRGSAGVMCDRVPRLGHRDKQPAPYGGGGADKAPKPLRHAAVFPRRSCRSSCHGSAWRTFSTTSPALAPYSRGRDGQGFAWGAVGPRAFGWTGDRVPRARGLPADPNATGRTRRACKSPGTGRATTACTYCIVEGPRRPRARGSQAVPYEEVRAAMAHGAHERSVRTGHQPRRLLPRPCRTSESSGSTTSRPHPRARPTWSGPAYLVDRAPRTSRETCLRVDGGVETVAIATLPPRVPCSSGCDETLRRMARASIAANLYRRATDAPPRGLARGGLGHRTSSWAFPVRPTTSSLGRSAFCVRRRALPRMHVFSLLRRPGTIGRHGCRSGRPARHGRPQPRDARARSAHALRRGHAPRGYRPARRGAIPGPWRLGWAL